MTVTTKETNNSRTIDIELDTQALRLSDADLQGERKITLSPTSNEHQATECLYQQGTENKFCPYRFVPLEMGGNGGTHKPSTGSAGFIEEIPLKKFKKLLSSHAAACLIHSQNAKGFFTLKSHDHSIVESCELAVKACPVKIISVKET